MKKRKITAMLMSVILIFSTSTSVYSETLVTDDELQNEVITQTEILPSEETQGQVKIVSEVEELRGEYTKHFQLDNGEFMAVSYSTPVNYKDENGNWQSIDNTLVEADIDGRQIIKNRDGLFNVEFAQDGTQENLVKITKDNYSIDWYISSISENVEIQPIEPIPEISSQAEEFDETLTQLPETEIQGAEETESLEEAQILEETQSTTEIELLEEVELTEETEPIEEMQPIVSQIETVFSQDAVAEIISSEDISVFSETDYAVPTESISAIKYDNVFSDEIDLKYTLFATSLKEDIIVSSPNDISAYNIYITVSNLTPTLQSDNSITFSNASGKIIFTMAAPYMYDATGAESYSIETELTTVSTDEYIITITPDAEWLKSADRVYPVTIDPSVNVSCNSSNTADRFVSSNNTSNSGYESMLGAGEYLGMQFKTLIKLINPISLPSGANVSSANLRFFATQVSTQIPTLRIRTMAHVWDENNATWNETSNHTGQTITTAAPTYVTMNGNNYYSYTFNLTTFAQIAVKGTYNFSTVNGFVIDRYSDEGFAILASSTYAFSEARPIFSVTYSRSADLIQPGRYAIDSRTADMNTNANSINTALWYFIEEQGYYRIVNVDVPTFNLGYNSNWNAAYYTVATDDDIEEKGESILWSLSVVSGTNYIRIHPKADGTKALTVPSHVTLITSSTTLTLTSSSSSNQNQQWEFVLQPESHTFGAPLSMVGANTETYRVHSDWGYRGSGFHKGIDIPGDEGKDVLCVADGIVTEIDIGESEGYYITIRHFGMINGRGEYYYTRYQHLLEDSTIVNEDDVVKKGQKIAEMGNTGESEGPHLHFEVWNGSDRKDNTINPFVDYNADDSRNNIINSNTIYLSAGKLTGNTDDDYIIFETNPNFCFTFDDDDETDNQQKYGQLSFSVSTDYGYTGTDDNCGQSGYWRD